MDNKVKFNKLVAAIRRDVHFAPQIYGVIGGAWTRDTWTYNGLSVQLEDEGETVVLKSIDSRFHVVSGGDNQPKFIIGTESDLARFAAMDCFKLIP